ncbi:S1C family serine protease [Megalodesulfovibrio paquesii]
MPTPPCLHRPNLAMFLCTMALLGVFAGIAYGIDAQSLFQRSGPSVVVVVGKDSAGRDVSLGSGFYVQNNLVVTNNHVVERASRIELRHGQEKPVPVKRVRAVDKENDLALLEVAASGEPLPLKTGHPSVGEEVLAIGNPKGLERTISPGIVSGLRKDKQERIRYQITAPISPGSSGGPILDADGEVIGLATFFVMDGQNLNFAVPSLYVTQLINGGRPASDSPSRPGKRIEVKEDPSGVITIK